MSLNNSPSPAIKTEIESASPGPLIISLGISFLVVFHIVDGPHGALNVFHPLEAFVQTQIMAHSVLKDEKISFF